VFVCSPHQAEIESTYLECDQGYCTEIRDEYVRHFLTGEFVTGERAGDIKSQLWEQGVCSLINGHWIT
jgi:hypothetical protein